MPPRRAKIVATVGPASREPRRLRALLAAGADVVRLNLSHGSQAEHRETIARLRVAAAELGKPVPLLLDLMGPRFRLAQLPDGSRTLAAGARLTLGPASAAVDLPVDDPRFLAYLERGERVLIDNGLVELEIVAQRGQRVTARVVHGGDVATRKGINLPDSAIPFSITAKDAADIRFAVAVGADFLAVSYVARGADLARVRAAVAAAGGDQPLVAKIERRAAVEALPSILEAADALMVARGDLGVELPLDQVPILQKRIVAAGRRAGKPVIVATQMLESMIAQPRPTRAESSDVANAVFDGADAVMLSGETAAGRYPVAAVRTMARIVLAAEGYRTAAAERPGEDEPTSPATEPRAAADEREIAETVAAAAVHAAARLPRSRLVAFSQGGFTAQRLARHRPIAPAHVFASEPRVLRRMQLLWGIEPLPLEDGSERHDDFAERFEAHLRARGRAHRGDCLVVLMGYPPRRRPLTNLLQIRRVAALPKLPRPAKRGKRAPE